jgi:NADPH-dependent 2,4-dienoyl-CoA reductase/sulfur reductase-like enzyme
MFSTKVPFAACNVGRSIITSQIVPRTRNFATASSVISTTKNHKVVVVGGGSAGLAISHQLLRTGNFAPNEIAIIDPAAWHDYQPGWTLVGGGLKNKGDLRKPMKSLVDSKIKHYGCDVGTFSPNDNFVTLGNGDKISYEQLIVAPGIKIDYESIKGLPEALANPDSLVSTIYSYDSCNKVFPSIEKLKKGVAIFTQPAGVIKCAGAPQKIMWLALDHWKRAGLYQLNDASKSDIKISFATGLAVMFGVPKYSAKLEELRKERGVEGLFSHDLISVDGNTATFVSPDGKEAKRHFDFLHVTPKMGPHAFVKDSELANEAGYVDVDQATTRHTKYSNVWSAGDASSLPTSKTVAAITSQTPVLVRNLLQSIEGKELDAKYDGYTSCPLLTEYGKLMLAEFKYGGEPKETFGGWLGIDQATPRRAFYHLKKDFFPWVYYQAMVKGTWAGPKGFIR